LCDRVLVLVRGRAVSEFSGEALRTHAILEAMNQGSKAGS
jgi:ABC-type sugar transport system ATPase subunit